MINPTLNRRTVQRWFQPPLSLKLSVIGDTGGPFIATSTRPPYSDQNAAIMSARKLAIAKRKHGHNVKVVLRRTDGNEVIQAIDD